MQDDAEGIEQEAKEIVGVAQEGLDEPNKIVGGGLGLFLAVCASFILLGSNYKRVKFISIYIKP